MNAIDLLKDDHRKVKALFEKFKENESGSHGALFKQIRNELVVHTHIEEKIFYPDLLKRGKKDLKDLVREGLEEHRQVKKILAEMEKMTPRNKAYNPKLKVIVEDVEHHVEEEEGEMFDMVEDQLTKGRLETLGKEMEAEKARVQKKMGIKPAPAPKQEKGTLDTIVEKTKELVSGVLSGGNGKAGNGKAKAKSVAAKNKSSKDQRSRTKASPSAKGAASGR